MKRLIVALALLATPAFATLSDTTEGRQTRTGDGATTIFVYTFPAGATADVTATVTVAGVVQPATYSVILFGDQINSPGGTVTFTSPPVLAATITIQRSESLTQQTSLPPFTPFPAKTVERTFDGTVRKIQQVDRRVGDLETKQQTDISNTIAGGVGAANLIAPIATGGLTAVTLADRFARSLWVSDFLPVNYVTNCTVDYTSQINSAITAAETSLLTHTLRFPKGCFKVTSPLSTANINVYGESGAAFTPANTITEIDCYGAGACLTFISTVNGGGNNLEGISFVSKAAGQTGLIFGESFTRISNVGLKNFDTNCLQAGISGSVGAFYSDVSNVVCSNDTTQAARGVLVSGGTPAANANHFRNIVLNGKFTTLWEINGTKNIVWGGDLDPDVRGTGVSNLWLITGTENEINGPYVEAGGGSMTPTTKIANFTSTSWGNVIREVNYTMPMSTYGNQTSAIVDAGWSNRVSFRGVGFNFPMTTENRGIANLVPNSGFQQWDTSGLGQPTGWVNFGGTLAQDTTTTHGTAISLKATAVNAAINLTGYIVSPSVGDKSVNSIALGYFLGKQMTCSVWCKSSFANVGNLRAGSNGTGGVDYGAMSHTGSGNWELLVATVLIPVDATKIDISLRSSNGGPLLNGDIWFSEPMCSISPEVPHYAPRGIFDTGGQLMGPLSENPPIILPYSASIATDASLGNNYSITATNNVAFLIASPTNLKPGQKLLYTIINTSGGALGAVTLGGTFKAPALTLPATGNNRSYEFQYNGTNLRFLWQTASDVAN